MKKIMKSVIGVSLSLGLSSILYATDTTDTGNNLNTTCYAVSDDIAEIYIISPDSTNVQEATVINTSSIHGDTKGKYNGEASAFNSKSKKLYLFNNPSLGTTDDDNKFDIYSVDISDINNPKQRIIKKNFINFEPTGADYYNEKLYIIEEGTTSTLYVYNTKTWEIESQLSIAREIAAFAINHKTGDAYVMDDRDTSPVEAAELLKLDLKTGALTSVGVLSNDDFDGESLSFGADGKLYTENERKESKRSIYEISTSDASVTLVAYLPGENSNDIESISCSSSDVVVVKPITDDKVNPKMLNSLGAVNILNLSGKDANGNPIKKFMITSLPSADQGVLYMEDGITPVTLNQELTLEEANQLKFDPKEDFVGDVIFNYVSVFVDDNGNVVKGNEATVTIPLISPNEQVAKPTTDDKINPEMLNTLDAVNILNLSGKDANGTAVKNFIITSLPDASEGILYMADGKTPVTLNQELTLEEANGIKFDPNKNFVGDVTFHYVAVDDNGVKGNKAVVTIPLVAPNGKVIPPLTNDITNEGNILNSAGAVNISDLSGTDYKGKSVEHFIVKSLPTANQGILYMADGTTPVRVDQNLTLEEANGLKFDPSDGFVGNATFNYTAIDNNGIEGNEATVNISVISDDIHQRVKPTTDNKVNPKILNSLDAVDITNLSGTDSTGNAIKRFIITELPSEDKGVLYMADGTTLVTLNQELTLEEANGLKFDPNENFEGDVVFSYIAIDDQNLQGNVATVTIPVVKDLGEKVIVPVADDKINPAILNSLGAVNITNLSGTDANGTTIERFIITSLPSADQGVLYMADGKTPVTLNQELTLEEANGIKFDPNGSFVGDAVFNYVALDNNGVRGDEATVTIPVIAGVSQQLPTADNKINPELLNSMGAVNITNLSGTDSKGNAVKRFMITSLPSADQGVLYMADGTTPVTLNQELTLEEANGLRFDPKEGFVGNVIFSYISIDNDGLKSKEATVTLSVVTEHEGGVIKPSSDDRINPAILNSLGAVNITDLSGTDLEGNAVKRFVITSLPSADQGVLYMADGTTPVTLNQELTLEEANGLRFDPNSSFVGDAVFNYVTLDNNGVRGDVATVTIPVISGTTEECVCEDYTEDVPVLNRLGILLTMLFSSLFGLRFIRKEGGI